MKANLQRKGSTLCHVVIAMESDAFVGVLLMIVAIETVSDGGNDRRESSLS